MKCNKSIIYPIFGWNDLNKEEFDRDNNKIKEYLKLIEKELEKNEYIIGNKMTLADIKLYKLFPKINKWFEKIMKTPEAMKAYGRTILCKNILKPFNGKIERNKGKEENKKENKGKHDKKENEIKTKDQVKKDETKEEEPYP